MEEENAKDPKDAAIERKGVMTGPEFARPKDAVTGN